MMALQFWKVKIRFNSIFQLLLAFRKRKIPKSIKEPDACSPLIRICFSFRWSPLGRTSKTAGFSFRIYCFPLISKSIFLLFKSLRFICPSITFSQVGELLSSKSAMKQLAPEFIALIIILRSTGYVISTRLSSKESGRGSHTQFPFLISSVSFKIEVKSLIKFLLQNLSFI